jgi:PHD/YefM family antitoxin component YafN of YafNO toxin-antitoxin module
MPALASLHPQYIIDHQGHRASVLLPVEKYETLLENLNDLSAIAERREELVVDHDTVIARLKTDGLL